MAAPDCRHPSSSVARIHPCIRASCVLAWRRPDLAISLSTSGDRPLAVDLGDYIRDVPDFPKPGIVFKDITPLLLDPKAFDHAVTLLADHARSLDIDLIVAAE